MKSIKQFNRLLASVALLALCLVFAEASQVKIAFMSARDGNFEIYVMNADGTEQTRVTNNAASDTRPAFSPDGSKIAFTSTRDGNWEIYVMNADGTGQTRLTQNAFADWDPAFNHDGSKIAFVSSRDGNEEVYVMNADGSGQTNLTNNPSLDPHPAFSPDGSKIAFHSSRDGNWEIYVMNADGTGQTRLTFGAAIDAHAAFSPDGSKIAFYSTRDGNEEIYVMNADGTGPTRLTNNAARDYWPAFSPDGSKIAFHSNRDGNWEIYVMNADGTGATNLTNNAAYDADPSFPLTQNTTVTPDSFFIRRGVLTSGSKSDLLFSDDLRLDVRAGLTLFLGEPPLQVVVTATSPVESPRELRFTLEASVNTPGLTQAIELFNYDTSSYEQVDLGIPGAMDTIVEVVITTNPGRFVQAGTREMRAKVVYQRVGFTLLWPWSARLDQTVWTIVH